MPARDESRQPRCLVRLLPVLHLVKWISQSTSQIIPPREDDGANTAEATENRRDMPYGSAYTFLWKFSPEIWIAVDLLPTANPSPAFLVVATCDRLTVVISTSHVWNLLRTEDIDLHTPALQTGTHFLLTLDTIVFLFHLLGATSKPFSSLSTRLAHAARLGFFFYKKNALYKFTVITVIIILLRIVETALTFWNYREQSLDCLQSRTDLWQCWCY